MPRGTCARRPAWRNWIPSTQPHTPRLGAALAAGELETAARWFRVALAAGASDPVSAHTDLAEAYFRSGAHLDARAQTLAGLELAPTYPRAQDLLLAIVDTGR